MNPDHEWSSLDDDILNMLPAELANKERLALMIGWDAARRIAEFGDDYGTAKQQALQAFAHAGGGSRRGLRSVTMLSNEDITELVKCYQSLYMTEEQAAECARLRKVAGDVMTWLSDFRPELLGAVANGTADQHSVIHLLCFADDPKALEIFLLNEHARDPRRALHMQSHAVHGGHGDRDMLQITWGQDTIMLSLHPCSAVTRDSLRKLGLPGGISRLNLEALQRAQSGDGSHQGI